MYFGDMTGFGFQKFRQRALIPSHSKALRVTIPNYIDEQTYIDRLVVLIQAYNIKWNVQR